jgi:hypothetical protein
MHLYGILLGLVAFIIMGVLHPVVVKAEYYFTKKIWIVFLILGIIFSVTSVLVENIFISYTFGFLAFSFFFSILEVIEQEKRVQKGIFPKNPNRKIN